nr:nuclear transport factor 2 family protein [Herbaspirillum sp. ASV7]
MSLPSQPSSRAAIPAVTVETLQAFSDAWNRHDIAALMDFMHPDCEFLSAAGHDAHGSRHTGTEAVARAFASAWLSVPDAQWRNGRHWVAGERGVSEWTFTGTAADGTPIEADGVDLFVFRDGKILQKNVFRKNRTARPA